VDAAVVQALKFDWEQIAEKWRTEFERIIAKKRKY
jgi:hypothetical protein